MSTGAPTPGGIPGARPTLVDASRSRAARRLVVVTAGLSEPSSTRLLADLLGAAAAQALESQGGAELEVVELRPLAHALTDALLTGFATGDLAAGPGGGGRRRTP